MRKTFLILFLCVACIKVSAQEFFVGADVVSNYMWRGLKNGNAAIQPEIGFTIGGFSISAWGSTELREENNEVDFILTYEFKNFTFSLMDIYTQNDDEESNFFNYSSRTTGHIIDLGAQYTLSEKFPLSVGWYTLIAGNDYKENDKRAWSTYIQLLYPFDIGQINLELEAGLTPWEGMYSDRLNVTNLALKATKEFHVSDSFTLPVFAQVGTNPYEKNVYFVFGLTF